MSFGPWPLGAAERAFIRYARGNRAGALADLANAGGGNASIPLVLVDTSRAAIIYRHGGDSSGAAAIERFEADTGRDFESLAFLRLIRGDSAGAIAALEMMRATPDTAEARCGAAPCSVSLRTWRALHNPVLRKLERDPRYQRLLAETRPRIPW